MMKVYLSMTMSTCPSFPSIHYLGMLSSILHYCMCTDIGKERPELVDISNHIVPEWSPQWRQLGMELRIAHYMIDRIEHDHPNNCRRCCLVMLEDWLDSNSAATWEDLIVAVLRLSNCGMGASLVLLIVYI